MIHRYNTKQNKEKSDKSTDETIWLKPDPVYVTSSIGNFSCKRGLHGFWGEFNGKFKNYTCFHLGGKWEIPIYKANNKEMKEVLCEYVRVVDGSINYYKSSWKTFGLMLLWSPLFTPPRPQCAGTSWVFRSEATPQFSALL